MRYALAIVLLLACLKLHAQSYDFTLTDDPAFCGAACGKVVGSGTFSIGSPITQLNMTLYPITSLSGTLNGLPLSLFSPPLNSISYNSSANFFYTVQEPIAPFFPLLLASGAALGWNVQSTDLHHAGTGQTMYDYKANEFDSVSFTVSPASQPTEITLKNRVPAPRQPGIFEFPLPSKAPAAFRANHNVEIGISLTAAVATGIAIYEWHKHRQHWDAVPAGRLR